MRVIGGVYRSRRLMAPRGPSTRPTSDRLRETLFNLLAPRLESCRFADLYAGTGAVGIEALSRGAAHVWFAESAASAAQVLRANLAALGIDSGFTVEAGGTATLLSRLESIDVVFLDPPYEAEGEYVRTLGVLGSAAGALILAADAVVIAEHAARSPPGMRFAALEHVRTVKQGDAALSLYLRRAESQEGGRKPPPV